MNTASKAIAIGVIAFVLVASIYVVVTEWQLSSVSLSEYNMEVEQGNVVVRDVPLPTDFTNAKVDEKEIIDGCSGKDCIPSIDEPQFESIEEATWLADDDIVFTIDYKGIQRAYPQRILNWHEIVNDTIAGDPITITFCPLCGSAVAFERTVNNVITEFGVSGKLHNNDLIMYDRYEGNLWQQITGEGIVGPAAIRNEVLTPVTIGSTTWGEWKTQQPDTQVLSRETGYQRDYDRYPYGTYEENDELLFGIEELDTSLQIKTVVYGVEVNGASKAYPLSVLQPGQKIQDTVGNIDIIIQLADDGTVEVETDSGEEIVPLRLFWFAWAAFHPDTELYQ